MGGINNKDNTSSSEFLSCTRSLAVSMIYGLFYFQQRAGRFGSSRYCLIALQKPINNTQVKFSAKAHKLLAWGDQLLWGSGLVPVSNGGVSRKWSWIWGFVWISMEHNRATSGPPPCAGFHTSLLRCGSGHLLQGFLRSAKHQCPARHQLPISFSQWGTEKEPGASKMPPAENDS